MSTWAPLYLFALLEEPQEKGVVMTVYSILCYNAICHLTDVDYLGTYIHYMLSIVSALELAGIYIRS